MQESCARESRSFGDVFKCILVVFIRIKVVRTQKIQREKSRENRSRQCHQFASDPSRTLGVNANGKRSPSLCTCLSFSVFTRWISMSRPNSARVCRHDPHGPVKPVATSLKHAGRSRTAALVNLRGDDHFFKAFFPFGNSLDHCRSLGTGRQRVRDVLHVASRVDLSTLREYGRTHPRQVEGRQ